MTNSALIKIIYSYLHNQLRMKVRKINIKKLKIFTAIVDYLI